MLGGDVPLIIFHFYTPNALAFASKLPIVSAETVDTVGFPVPIYLSEGVTGIFVDTESKSLDVETSVQARADGKKPIVDQRIANSALNVRLFARSDSTLINVLRSISGMALALVAAKGCKVSYFNGPVVIIKGLLEGLVESTNKDNNEIEFDLKISDANQESTLAAAAVAVLSGLRGATPADLAPPLPPLPGVN